MSKLTSERLQRRWLDDLGCNLSSGLRLAFWMRLNVSRLRVSLGQLITLALLLFAVDFITAYAQVEPPRAFNLYGIDYLAAIYLFDLLLILLGARLVGADTQQFGKLVTGMLGASLPVTLVMQCVAWLMLGDYPSPLIAWGYLVLALAWNLLILLRLLRGIVGARSGRAFAAALVYTLGSLAGLWLIPRIELWYTDYRSEGVEQSPFRGLNVEDIYYAQPALMHQRLAELREQRPGVVDLYLLAFAGYGPENVFLNEVEYVQEQFDNRYDTGGRSLILANNVDAVHRYPLANRHNLSNALGAIADRMDTNEDILFLFMTSHGSSDHRFSVEMGPLQLGDLTAPELRAALDDAGIRWRVILVSSCYSGGFIEPLKTPETLIITAASADRTSFGCGSQSDFTYFGTAFFKQALMEEPRFIEAFERARGWVTEREVQDGFTPSEPQRFVGARISDKLDAYYADPRVQQALINADEEYRACLAQSDTLACR
ncbi:MAG: hypothetical protein GYB21_14145 [Oceanospirillales bacterium]|nr:hypothetical protein [Oceanospirillales bacterium]